MEMFIMWFSLMIVSAMGIISIHQVLREIDNSINKNFKEFMLEIRKQMDEVYSRYK